MRIGIKYCGGCNPTYKREEIEEILRKHFQILYSTCADLLVCISGCKRGCAERADEKAIHFNERTLEEEILKQVKEKLVKC
ncbi:MAG: hypothetical protein N3D09_01685 [Archaeoglobaceae archaeon]|nr:hypothetical protein [Archaeoglobaceae archaeon]